MHLKVLQLRYCGRDSIIQVRKDLIFIMVPLGEQKQMEVVQTHKTSCRYVTIVDLLQFYLSNYLTPSGDFPQDVPVDTFDLV